MSGLRISQCLLDQVELHEQNKEVFSWDVELAPLGRVPGARELILRVIFNSDQGGTTPAKDMGLVFNTHVTGESALVLFFEDEEKKRLCRIALHPKLYNDLFDRDHDFDTLQSLGHDLETDKSVGYRAANLINLREYLVTSNSSHSRVWSLLKDVAAAGVPLDALGTIPKTVLFARANFDVGEWTKKKLSSSLSSSLGLNSRDANVSLPIANDCTEIVLVGEITLAKKQGRKQAAPKLGKIIKRKSEPFSFEQEHIQQRR
ncbi:hypothetical protein R1sor_008099 [Riccia sorocarpa]|uniref:Uncharacterized protein n=1 Tax=Riccia sorocarpa TaxID=122646 RepID=A0ABD3HSS0_9MARC